MLLSLEVIKADRINEQFKTRNTYFYQNFPQNSSLRQQENNERKKVL